MSILEIAQALWLLPAAFGVALSVTYSGLPFLGQSAFIAVGGYGVAMLGPGGVGLPLGIAAATAVLIAAVIGYLMAVGLFRLGGAYLALATWTLAWLAQRILLAYPEAFGGPQGLTRTAPAHLVSRILGVQFALTTNISLVLASVIGLILVLAFVRIDYGAIGIDLAGLRESPKLAASLGIPVASPRRVALTVTAALGAVSGVGLTVLLGIISPADVSPLLSLQLFVVVLIGGARWWGPVLGVALLTALPHVANGLADAANVNAERTSGVLTAALLFVVLALRGPLRRRVSRRSLGPYEPAWRERARAAETTVADATLSYAGVRALDGVSLTLRAGKVHALIGPNGSGKSTLLDVFADRVPSGLVRTPQQPIILAGLTPAQQVALAARVGSPFRGLMMRELCATPLSRVEAARVRVVVGGALCDTGLEGVADTDPTRLTVGEAQLLQVARAIATGASTFLFDEPTAGMDPTERDRLRALLRRLARNGCAVLIVEHDVGFVATVANSVTVLGAGRVIASGRPDEIRADTAVRQVYLDSR